MLKRTLFAIIAAASTGAIACSGGSPQQGQTDEVTTTAADAISAVQGCSSAGDTCEADAGDAGEAMCKRSMCSCLSRLGAEPDGGRHPFEAGPELAAIEACLTDLRTCVSGATDAGSTDPRTCAEDAITCLKSVIGSVGLGAPDGRAPFPPFPGFDGGSFPRPGFPGLGFGDAGFPSFGFGDAGFPSHAPAPWGHDAGHP